MLLLRDPSTFKRRALVYSRRSWQSMRGSGLNRPCAFLHLPKCGGTSLAAGLYGTVPLHLRIGVIDAISTRRAAAITAFGRDDPVLCHEELEHGHLTFALRQQMVLVHMAWGSRLIHGHFFLDDKILEHFASGYGLVTMMRDPADRALSNYRMAVRAGVIPDDVDAWLDGPVGQSMAQACLRYLFGQNVVPPKDLARALDTALGRLEMFSVIGFLENVPAFQSEFARQFGPRPAMPSFNVGSGPAVRLTDGQAERLERLVAADRQLYRHACGMFPELAPGATP